MLARAVSVLVLAVLLVVGLPRGAAAAAEVVLRPPVDGRVVHGFDVPTRYGAGHRGVDLVAWLGTPVHASAAGTVTFAGTVAGAAWVTVDHGPVRTTVGPLSAVAVGRGDVVRAGQHLGASGLAHGAARLHWSARVGDRYVDPLAWARPLVASLVPTVGAGSSARAAPRVPAAAATPAPTARWARVR